MRKEDVNILSESNLINSENEIQHDPELIRGSTEPRKSCSDGVLKKY